MLTLSTNTHVPGYANVIAEAKRKQGLSINTIEGPFVAKSIFGIMKNTKVVF